jgi:hypothetical protein
MPHRLQIFRDRKTAVAVLFMCVFFVRPACAIAGGVSHGTYFATYTGDDYTALAIESRRTFDAPTGKRSVFDDACKVVALSARAVFIADGIISNSDPRAPRFDVFVDAVDAYRRATPAGSLGNAAELWAADLKRSITGLYPFYRDLMDHRADDEIVGGYFLGIDDDDKLTGFQVKITHAKATARFDAVVMPIQKGNYTLPGPGPARLVKEFVAGQSARAMAAQSQIRKEALGKSAAEARVVEMKYLVKTIPAWANDPGSGGDIAQIVIDAAEKRWRWIHRPDFCPEN